MQHLLARGWAGRTLLVVPLVALLGLASGPVGAVVGSVPGLGSLIIAEQGPTTREQNRARIALCEFYRQVGLPVPTGNPRFAAMKLLDGETVIDVNFPNASGSIEPESGDIRGVSLPKDRTAVGKPLPKEDILARADRLAKLRLPAEQRYLYKAELTPAGSPDLDISRTHGVYTVVYRELPGKYPTIDFGNSTSMFFNAVTGALQGYSETRCLKKVGPTEPRITADAARRVVEKELRKFGASKEVVDVVLGWAVPLPDFVPGTNGRELRLCFDVRLNDDMGWRVDATTGRLVGFKGKGECSGWELELDKRKRDAKN